MATLQTRRFSFFGFAMFLCKHTVAMILTQIPPFFPTFSFCVNRRDGDAPDTQILFDHQLCARCAVVYVYVYVYVYVRGLS
jgi:hypothetical protein